MKKDCQRAPVAQTRKNYQKYGIWIYSQLQSYPPPPPFNGYSETFSMYFLLCFRRKRIKGIKCGKYEKILKGVRDWCSRQASSQNTRKGNIINNLKIFCLFFLYFEFNSLRFLMIMVLFLNCNHRRYDFRAQIHQDSRCTDVKYVNNSTRREPNVIEIYSMDKRDTEMMMCSLPLIPRFKMMFLFRRSFNK